MLRAFAAVAGWAPFGCPLFWRPNGFIGFRTSAPQVHARQLFHDLDFLARGLDVAEADIALSFKHDLADEKRYIALFREKCMSDPLVWNPNWYGHRYYAIHLLKLGR